MLLLVFHAHFNMYSNKLTPLQANSSHPFRLKKTTAIPLPQICWCHTRSDAVLLSHDRRHMTVIEHDISAANTQTQAMSIVLLNSKQKSLFLICFCFFFLSSVLDIWVSFFSPLVFPHLGLEKKKINLHVIIIRSSLWLLKTIFFIESSTLLFDKRNKDRVPSFVPEEPSCSHHILPTSGNSQLVG